METNTYESVLHTLEEKREELIHEVAEQLFQYIPVVGVSSQIQDKVAKHHHNMVLTAERFHEIVQAGAIDWKLVSAEFGWAARKLPTMGVTHVHHEQMIDIYFETAARMCEWSLEQRSTLDKLASNLREAAMAGYAQVTE
jgi:hypothetical protein